MMTNKRKAATLKDMGLKCIVSDYALSQWYAQSFKLVDSKKTEPAKADYAKQQQQV